MNKLEYLNLRFSYNRDDRCDSSKLDNDAKLRGNIGVCEANRLIEIVDKEKERR
jgi:hypothetical protein